MKTGNYKTGNKIPTNKCSNIHDSSVTENRQWEMTFCTSASENLSIVRRQVHTCTGGLTIVRRQVHTRTGGLSNVRRQVHTCTAGLTIVRRQVHTRTAGLQFAKEEKSSINTSLL